MSMLEEKLRSTNFVVTTELTPPKGIDLSAFFAKADALKRIVDAVNITESPRARMAVEPKSVGHLLQDRGVEAVVQVTARDRNRIAIQADLLGGCLLGIGNFSHSAQVREDGRVAEYQRTGYSRPFSPA
jgi:methylenetetrahydrofolate reductase (NADPH)